MRAMEDSVQSVYFCVCRLKNEFTSRNVNWSEKKDTDFSAHNPLLCVKTDYSVYILVWGSYPGVSARHSLIYFGWVSKVFVGANWKAVRNTVKNVTVWHGGIIVARAVWYDVLTPSD